MESRLFAQPIHELLGYHFFIPDYQRGYRWTGDQVRDLLNDVWDYTKQPGNKERFYCLQPVVVRPRVWKDGEQERQGWEVIDGQQRLTTIHIVLSYLGDELFGGDLSKGFEKGEYSFF